jgi:hypothetical protein
VQPLAHDGQQVVEVIQQLEDAFHGLTGPGSGGR